MCALDHEHEPLLVAREDREGRLRHLVEHGLIGRVVVVHDARRAEVPALRDLVERHVHVAVAEEAEELPRAPGEGAPERRGGVGVGEARRLEVGEQVAAGVGRAGGRGREAPAGEEIRGEARVVRGGGARRAEHLREAPGHARRQGGHEVRLCVTRSTASLTSRAASERRNSMTSAIDSGLTQRDTSVSDFHLHVTPMLGTQVRRPHRQMPVRPPDRWRAR